jgi:hypothetical protein
MTPGGEAKTAGPISLGEARTNQDQRFLTPPGESNA